MALALAVRPKKHKNPSQSRNWREREGISPWLPDELFSPKFYDTSNYKDGELEKKKENDSFDISVSLKKSINDSKCLLELTDDWDGEGSLGYSELTLNKTIEFLEENARSHFLNSGVWVTAPEICPGPNGSIDLLWKLEDRELLINIPVEESGLADYYGDDLGINTIKGKLNLTEKHEWILMWLMK